MSSTSKPRAQLNNCWRLGVLLSLLSALAILIFNVALTIWSSSTYSVTDGIGTAFEGQCDHVERWSLGLKILINVLGSGLLAVSNYTMQCLSSPTRSDLDTAHGVGRWMDIGVPGLRNLRHIQWYRTTLWCGLIVSSIPVHLLYNSTIFKSLDTQIYRVVVADHEFLSNPTAKLTGVKGDNIDAIRDVQKAYVDHLSQFERLSNKECIKAYAQPTISGRSDVILVTNSSNSEAESRIFNYNNVNSFERYTLPYAWICKDISDTGVGSDPSISCNTAELEQNASHWTINGERIGYCLSREVKQHCKLQFSVYMMAAVIACNGIKAICMLLTLFQHTDDIIVTLGDAISSYLRKSDPLTVDKCLIAASDFKQLTEKGQEYAFPERLLRAATLEQTRWGAAVSRERWTVTAITFFGVLIIDAVFLIVSSTNAARDEGSSNILWTIGFGAVDSRALIEGVLPGRGNSNLVPATLIANLPQLLLSIAFVTYNGMFTSMLFTQEWQSFGRQRQPLRVSTPIGAQVSSRWLTLPYRYSLPLLAASSVMHFVTSNCLFAVRISIYERNKLVNGITQLGWSSYPMLTLIILGVIMIITTVCLARKKFQSCMPMVRACSFAIAAACHPPVAEVDAFKSEVQWGTVPTQSAEGDDVGHCSFSMDVVETPEPGRLYA